MFKLVKKLDSKKKSDFDLKINITSKWKANCLKKNIDNKYHLLIHNTYNLPPKKLYKKIIKNINSLDDLISLIKENEYNSNYNYNIKLKELHLIKNDLIEFNNFIGLQNLKNNILLQIIYYLSNPNIKDEYMHTVISGPPGTGKTEIAHSISKIFSKLGILKNNKVNKVTRSDLIGGFLGQTALKTKDVINKSLGGVLFIDEAYSLGNSDKKDSYSKECIDTLTECLSFHRNDLMVIIAGYKNQLQDCFFDYNPGLESRFAWRYDIDNYNPIELSQILQKKIIEKKFILNIHPSKLINWISENKIFFKNNGRDIEIFCNKIKIFYYKNYFCNYINPLNNISFNELNGGFKLYTNNIYKNNEPPSLNMYI